MGIGNGSQVVAPAIPATLGSLGIPFQPSGQWQSWNPANANSFVQDTIWGGNLTTNLSSFPGIIAPSSTDVGYMRFSSGSRGQASGFGNAGRSNVTNGVVSGVPFGKIKMWSARTVFFKDAGAGAVVYGMFIGMAKGIGLSGLFGGLGTLNSSQTDAGWRNAFPHVGFYFLPQSSNNWLIVCGDGSGSANLLDTGVPVDQVNTQSLQIVNKGSSIDYYIAGAKVGSFVSLIPTVPMNTDMGYAVFSAGNLSATGCVIGFAESGFGY